MKKSSEIAELLDLKPHPEGGYFSEIFRDSSITLSKSQLPNQYKVDRPISTAIYFLLPSGSVSHLHRIPCAETWHFYMGEPLTKGDFKVGNPAFHTLNTNYNVFELSNEGHIKLTILGTDLEAGHRPQYTVPPNVWFGSFPIKDIESYAPDGNSLVKAPERDPEEHYSLVGCTCAPAFQFQDFELATYADVIGLAPHAEPFIQYLTLSN